MAKCTGVSGQRKEAGVGAIIWNRVAKKPEAFHHGQQSELIELNVIEARLIPSSPRPDLFVFLSVPPPLLLHRVCVCVWFLFLVATKLYCFLLLHVLPFV